MDPAIRLWFQCNLRSVQGRALRYLVQQVRDVQSMNQRKQGRNQADAVILWRVTL